MAEQVKDPGLSQLWLGSLQWNGFKPWLRNFHLPPAQPKKRELKPRRILWVPPECKSPRAPPPFCIKKKNSPRLPQVPKSRLKRLMMRTGVKDPLKVHRTIRCVSLSCSVRTKTPTQMEGGDYLLTTSLLTPDWWAPGGDDGDS